MSNIGKERALVTPQGPNLTRVAKGSGPNVYYISGGQKRYVSSWAKLAAKGASKSDLITVSDYFLNRLPTGPSL